MKEIKTREAHVEQKEYVDKIICDICERECKNGNWEINEIKIQANIGEVYPEADCRTFYIIDCCKNCFLEKLKPLVEKGLNCNFREINSDERYSKNE